MEAHSVVTQSVARYLSAERVPRTSPPKENWIDRLAILLLTLLVAMTVASLLILLYGASPLHVYRTMVARTALDLYGWGQVLFRATPLVFTGLAVAMALHAGLFNVGVEGQLLVGCFATAWMGAVLPVTTPSVVAVIACVGAGMVAGGLLGAVPGILKVRCGAHEVLSTLMLNFVVQAVVLWLGQRWFFVEETVHTAPIIANAQLGKLGWAGSPVNLATLVAVAAAVACTWLMWRTRFGFELRAAGRSAKAAKCGGVAVGKSIVTVMALSGALAGLVGTNFVLGYKGYFEDGMGSGAGFMGIAVALLAQKHPVAVIPAALFLGALAQAGLSVNTVVPKELVEVIQAVIILALAVALPRSWRFQS